MRPIRLVLAVASAPILAGFALQTIPAHRRWIGASEMLWLGGFLVLCLPLLLWALDCVLSWRRGR
jgi:hypothetical protein